MKNILFRNWIVALAVYELFSLRVVAQKEFVHPGILHSKTSLEHIYEVVQKKTMPEYGSYELLKITRVPALNIR